MPFITDQKEREGIDEATFEEREAQVDSVAQQVRDITKDYEGFAGLIVDPATLRVTVWWCGNAPDALLNLQADSGKVTMDLRQADATRDQLMAAAKNTFFPADGVWPIPNATVSIRPDGSALVVSVDPADVDKFARDEERLALAKAAGVQVMWVQEDAPVALVSRQADTMRGGSGLRFHTSPQGYCSTSFAVLDNGYGRLLSAAHCDPTGSHAVYTGNDNTQIAPASLVKGLFVVDGERVVVN